MINTFADTETKRIYEQLFSRRFPYEIQKTALRKLMLLDQANDLRDLLAPPGNRLEALHGDREGQYSIRVNDRYRICFRFEPSGAYDVELVDYH
jgi:proteic killer suppression protein